MAANFNGSTDALSRTSGNPTITSFTMMAWVRWTSYSGWHLPLTIGQNASGAYYTMGTSPDFSNNLIIGNSVGYSTTTTPTTGTWYHIALTCSGTGAGALLGYRDGAQVLSLAGSGTPTNAKMWFGNTPDSDFHNGEIMAGKVYGAVLTADEISAEMRQIMPVRLVNLNSWLPLVDASASNFTVNWAGVNGDFTAGGTLTTASNAPIPWRAAAKRTYFVFGGGGGVSVASRMTLLGVG